MKDLKVFKTKKCFRDIENISKREYLLICMLWLGYIPDDRVKDERINDEFLNLIDSGEIDLNYVDVNEDTLFSVAALSPYSTFVVKHLLENPDVDINVVNDIGYTAFGNALRFKNYECAKLIGRSPKLKLSLRDRDLLNFMGVSLENFINS